MGYSMLTVRNGTEYRYTEWVDFNTKVSGGTDWGRVTLTLTLNLTLTLPPR